MKAKLLPLAMIILAGCSAMGPKEAGGTLAGAGAGGLIGSQFGGGAGKGALAGLGVVLGGLAGSEVGKSLDRADQLAMAQVTQHALESSPSNQSSAWRNPDTGNYGSVTPLRSYDSAQGPCREFQQSVVVGGRSEQAYGTACRQADGSWRVVQ